MSTRRTFGYIRKLPSGKHQASYVGPDEIRYNAPNTFKTKTEATTWLKIEEAAILANTWTKPGSHKFAGEITVTFEDYVLRHIEIQTNIYGELLRDNTKALYKRLLNTKLKSFHGLKLDQVNASHVAEWWAKETKGGRRTSASKAYKLMSAAFKRAVEEKLLTDNPCKVKGAQTATSGKKIAVPTAEEVALIASKINVRYTNLVILAAYGGFRFGEITELRRKDFTKAPRALDHGMYVDAYTIEVSRAVALVEGKHLVNPPKSKASVRSVPITSMLTPLVDSLLAALPEDPEALIFPSATGGHLRHDVFTNSWTRALKNAGLSAKKYSPNTLRHFAGTELGKYANLAEIKAWLGDSSTSAVMRYLHATTRTELLVNSMDMGLTF